MSPFPKEDFLSALRQFETGTSGAPYERFLRIADVWDLERRPLDSGLYDYKVRGTFPRIDTELLLRVYLDYEFRPAWDANVLAVKPVVGSWDPFDNPDHSFVAFYGLKYPLFMASREYHFAMHRKTVRRKDRRFHIILARSIDPTGTGFRLPHLSSGHVVVDPYRQTIVMTPTSDGKGTEIEMVYHENPRGNIPQALINWAAKNGLPRFISSLESACAKYEAYLLSKGRAPIRPLSEPALLEDDEAEEGKDEEAIDGEMDRAESGATNV